MKNESGLGDGAGAGPVFVVDKKIKMREKHFSGLTSVKTITRNRSREKVLCKHNNNKTKGVSVADR